MPIYVYWPNLRLGEGGDGIAYAGEARYDIGRPEPIVVKVMYDSQREDPVRLQRFLNEARIGYICGHHKHLVLTRAYGRLPDGSVYLVFDREAISLDHADDKIVADMPAIRAVALGVLRGLHHLHQYGIEHYDINRGNIFIGCDGVVRLGDFGNARPEAVNASPRWSKRLALPDISEAAWPRRSVRFRDRVRLARVLYALITGTPLRTHPTAAPVTADMPPDLVALIRALWAPTAKPNALIDAIALVRDGGLPIASHADMHELAQRALAEHTIGDEADTNSDSDSEVTCDEARIITEPSDRRHTKRRKTPHSSSNDSSSRSGSDGHGDSGTSNASKSKARDQSDKNHSEISNSRRSQASDGSSGQRKRDRARTTALIGFCAMLTIACLSQAIFWLSPGQHAASTASQATLTSRPDLTRSRCLASDVTGHAPVPDITVPRTNDQRVHASTNSKRQQHRFQAAKRNSVIAF